MACSLEHPYLLNRYRLAGRERGEPQSPLSPFRWVLALVSLIAAGVVSYYVIARHWPEGGASLGLPWWTHFALLGVVAAELACRGLKIAMGARACGITLSAGTAVRATLCGDFLDAITPARVGAEPARFLVLREAGVPIAPALVILFLELFLELLSLVVIAIALVLLLPWSRALAAVASMVGVYATFVFALALVGYLGGRRGGRESPEPETAQRRWIDRMRLRFRHLAQHLQKGMEALRSARLPILAIALAFGVLHVLARLAVLPVILSSAGAAVALVPIVVWPLVLLYAAALAPAPSGGGAMELGFSAALSGVIPAAFLGAALIWWRLYSFFIYVALGALAAGGTAMRALRLKDTTTVR
jgi:glycosyltransferase 2 family protein